MQALAKQLMGLVRHGSVAEAEALLASVDGASYAVGDNTPQQVLVNLPQHGITPLVSAHIPSLIAFDIPDCMFHELATITEFMLGQMAAVDRRRVEMVRLLVDAGATVFITSEWKLMRMLLPIPRTMDGDQTLGFDEQNRRMCKDNVSGSRCQTQHAMTSC